MNNFKHSILALMHLASNPTKIGRVNYFPQDLLSLSYDDVILNPTYYDKKSIFFIDQSRKSSSVNSNCHSVIESYSYLKDKSLIKINDMEVYNEHYIKFCTTLKKLFKVKKVDCHIYFGKKNSFSFNFHKDSMDVLLYCLDGKKDIKFKKRTITINSGSWLFIPRHTNHKAEYPSDSITLSFGLYK